MEWIKKRLNKESDDLRNLQTPMKLHFHQTVYHVNTEEGNKDQDMKKVYKDLKDNFKLLYPTEIAEH